MWEAWNLAKAYHRRPSEIYGIRDEVAAWCFDRAVFMFGSEVEADVREAVDGAKNKQQATARQQRAMAKWLGGEQRFRDPAANASGPVKL